MLKIYNTLSREKQEFKPLVAGQVRMYVCGMTVYDYCHLGHARVMVVFDMVTRWLRAAGYQVTYVRNITDIDDKIIKRAAENKEPMEALTARFIGAMYWVARGSKSGLITPSAAASSSIAAMKRAVSASIGSLFSAARLMILSSMSVMLRT